MTQSDRLSWRGHSQIRQIHSRLATTKDHHIFLNSKLAPLLEFRRMRDFWYALDPLGVCNVGNNVKAGADSNGIAGPLFNNITTG